MTVTRKCDFCDKRGLPLLLVRDAIAHANSGAPLASGVAIELPTSIAYYTKRLLRSGYINMFDEARRRWETYSVSSDGYLAKLLQTPGQTPVVPQKQFNCMEEGHRAVASCITVADPLNASKVWLGFSDVLWTDAVRKANEDETYRRRHMTEIDIKAVLKGNQKPHRSITQLTDTVAEYASISNQRKVNLAWSPFAFCSRQSAAERLKQEFENLRPGSGLIVTLPDPAGITQELAFLMTRKADEFINKNPEEKRKIFASTAIDQIQEIKKKQAEDREIEAAEELAKEQKGANPLGHWLSETTRARTDNLSKVTPAHLASAAESSWVKYKEKFNDKERQLWLDDFNRKFKKFGEEYIIPLAPVHVEWMRSSQLLAYFECNYDTRDAQSGAVYTLVVSNCITSKQDKKACAELYNEWLNGDIADPRNFLLRAMVLNQAITAEAIKSATAVALDFRQFPWDNLLGLHSSVTEKLGLSTKEIAVNLVTQVAGPLAKIFGKVMDGNTGFRAAVIAAGLISGHPIVLCEVVGFKREFHAYLVKELLQRSGGIVGKNQLRKAVAVELRRAQINGTPMTGSVRRRWLVPIDQEMINNLPNNLTRQQQAARLARSTTTVEAMEAVSQEQWRRVLHRSLGQGAITCILQVAILTKLYADEGKSLSHNKTDAVVRRYAGIVSIAVTMSEVLSKCLTARSGFGLSLGQGIGPSLAQVSKHAARVGGIATGILVAALDLIKFTEARAEGQYGLAWLYVGSAITGIALSLAIVFSLAIPIIGALIALSISIGLLIEYIKDDPIQDWLERCPWGIMKAQRYTDMETEQAQLLQALK